MKLTLVWGLTSSSKSLFKVKNYPEVNPMCCHLNPRLADNKLLYFYFRVNTRFALSAYNQSDMLANVRDLAREVPNGETNAFGALTKARDEIFAIGGTGIA